MSIPDLLMEQFEAGCKGTADVDMHEVLHAILADVVDSMRLALDEEVLAAQADKADVIKVVEDYIANNYGES